MVREASNHPLTKWRADNGGMTQESLAEELGVTPMTIWRWEKRERTPRRKIAQELSKKTGIPVLELLGMEDVS